jgi:hypothetical protein
MGKEQTCVEFVPDHELGQQQESPVLLDFFIIFI